MDPIPAWPWNRLAEDAENPETVARVPLYRMRPNVSIVNILELGPVRFRRMMYGAFKSWKDWITSVILVHVCLSYFVRLFSKS